MLSNDTREGRGKGGKEKEDVSGWVGVWPWDTDSRGCRRLVRIFPVSQLYGPLG